MYCGAVLSRATGQPPTAVVPENLDELVRAAMSGQASVHTVEAALAKQGGAPHTRPARVQAPPSLSRSPEPVPVAALELELEPLDIPADALAPLEDDEPLYAEEIPRPMTIPPGAMQPMVGPELGADFQNLLRLLTDARSGWETGQLDVAGDILGRMQIQSANLRTKLRTAAHEASKSAVSVGHPPEPGVSVRMVAGKAVSKPFSLYVECPNDPTTAPRIARALGVDGVTAHSLAVCRYPRAARRGEDDEWLAAMAERYRTGLGLMASVIPRDSLLDIGLPKVILGPAGRRGFQVSTAAVWAGQDHDPFRHGSGVQDPPIKLAVPGAIVVARYRGTNRGRGRGYGYLLSRENRIGVLDLHGPGVFLRLVENITDFTGMPGHDVGSARRSFRGFHDQLGLWFPGIRKLGPRVCRPPEPPDPNPEQPLQQALRVDGWSGWEEHTRQCRLMVGLSAT